MITAQENFNGQTLVAMELTAITGMHDEHGDPIEVVVWPEEFKSQKIESLSDMAYGSVECSDPVSQMAMYILRKFNLLDADVYVVRFSDHRSPEIWYKGLRYRNTTDFIHEKSL